MTRPLIRIASNERGNSVVELGLVAPLFAAFLIGMVDISRAVAERLRLEQAAQRSIERLMQGQEASATFANLQSDAETAAGSGSTATVTPRLECDGSITASGTAYFTSSCTSGQTKARYVEVSITRTFTPMFGTDLFPWANADGTVTLTGRAGIRIQ